MMYSPFNLSLFFFSEHFHTSFFCVFISSCQHLFPSSLLFLTAAFTSLLHRTLFGFFPSTLTETHRFLALSTVPRVTRSHICSTLSPSPYMLFPSRDQAYPSFYRTSLSFSPLILLAPTTASLLLIDAPTNLTLRITTWCSERPRLSKRNSISFFVPIFP